MKSVVDQETCIGCGMCIDICPKIFAYNKDGKSESIVQDIPAELCDKAAEAAEVCPTTAIIIE